MGYTNPYRANNYLGNFASDAAALTALQARKWDSNGDGTGDPKTEMWFVQTTDHKIRIYMDSGWRDASYKADHGVMDGLGDDDHTQYTRADGTRAFSGNQSMGTNKLTNLTDGSDPADAVNRSQLDTAIQGLDPKASVTAATTGVLPANTRTGDVLEADAVGEFPTVDGVAPVFNQEYLVQDEVTGVNNGIYELTVLGDGGTAWELTRRDDLAAGSSAAGAYCPVEEGTANGDMIFLCTNNVGSDVVNTDALVFATFSAVHLHNDMGGLQGGGSTERYHLEAEPAGDLVDGGDATEWHMHDSVYFTETELGSVAGGSEGASLIGTDSKTNLGASTDVEAALTNLDGKNPPKRSSAAGNPNAGAGTAGAIGDIYVDTTNSIPYMNIDGTNSGWIVI